MDRAEGCGRRCCRAGFTLLLCYFLTCSRLSPHILIQGTSPGTGVSGGYTAWMQGAKPRNDTGTHGKPLLGRRVAVITASDRCFAGTQADLSGPALSRRLTTAGAEVVLTSVLPDDRCRLTEALREAATRADLVLTTGGTGLAARDVTPEATLDACDRLAPGLAEFLRSEGTRQP